MFRPVSGLEDRQLDKEQIMDRAYAEDIVNVLERFIQAVIITESEHSNQNALNLIHCREELINTLMDKIQD